MSTNVTKMRVKGVVYTLNGKLYDTTGSNVDGSMTQSAITSELNDAKDMAQSAYALAEQVLEDGKTIIDGNVTNNPDEEDITTVINSQTNLGELKLKDRAYVPIENSKGYVILRKDKTFEEQIILNSIPQENVIYEIRYNFDLNNQQIVIPNNCILNFNGGCLKNGILEGYNTTILNNGEHIFDNVTLTGSYTNDRFEIIWFGGVTGSENNNSNALVKLETSCSNCQKEMYINTGEYYYSTPLICGYNHNIIIDGILVYNGDVDATALTIGDDDSQILTLQYKIRIRQDAFPNSRCIVDTTSMTADCPNNIGVHFINISTSYINLDFVKNFCYDVIFDGHNHGMAYNHIDVGLIQNSYKLLTITATGVDGWCNENKFFGGRFTVSTDYPDIRKVHRCVYFTSDRDEGASEYRNNANVFFSPCVEQAYICFEFDYGRWNTVYSARFEVSASIFPVSYVASFNEEKQTCISNVIGIQYRNNESLVLGNGVQNHVYIDSKVRNIEKCPYKIYDSGNIDWASDINGNLTTNKIYTRDGSPYFIGTTDSDGFITSGYIPTVSIDTTISKYFRVEIDKTARTILKLFDSNENVITDVNAITPKSFILNSDHVTFRFNADGTCNFRVSDDVKKIHLSFENRLSFQVRSFIIYSDNNTECNPLYEGCMVLPSKPIASSNNADYVYNNIISNVLGWRRFQSTWIEDSLPLCYRFDFTKFVSDGTNVCVKGLLNRTYSLKTQTAPLVTSLYSSDATIVNNPLSINVGDKCFLKIFDMNGADSFVIKPFVDTTNISSSAEITKINIIPLDESNNVIEFAKLDENQNEYYENGCDISVYNNGNLYTLYNLNSSNISTSYSIRVFSKEIKLRSDNISNIRVVCGSSIKKVAICICRNSYGMIALDVYSDRLIPEGKEQFYLPAVPTDIGNINVGDSVFVTSNNTVVVWNGSKWVENDSAGANVVRSGSTSERPSGSSIYVGFQFFDTTLGKPIYANAISGNTVTWVDATGTAVS